MKSKKIRILPFILLLASTSLLITSCSKDSTDLREQIIGQYSYTVEVYKVVDSKLVYVGDQGTVGDITGTMRVAKSTRYKGH